MWQALPQRVFLWAGYKPLETEGYIMKTLTDPYLGYCK